MVSDQVAITIATGLFTLVGTIFTGVMAYLLQRLNRKADDAAVAVEVAKTDLIKIQKTNDIRIAQNFQKLDEVHVVAEKTHALVNSAMLGQLQISMKALQRIADLTHDKVDIKEAEAAAVAFKEHEANQLEINKAAAEVEQQGKPKDV